MLLEEELQDKKQVQNLFNANPARKISIESFVRHMHLAEATIKKSAVMEPMELVLDTAAFAAKELIAHLKDSTEVHVEQVLVTRCSMHCWPT